MFRWLARVAEFEDLLYLSADVVKDVNNIENLKQKAMPLEF